MIAGTRNPNTSARVKYERCCHSTTGFRFRSEISTEECLTRGLKSIQPICVHRSPWWAPYGSRSVSVYLVQDEGVMRTLFNEDITYYDMNLPMMSSVSTGPPVNGALHGTSASQCQEILQNRMSVVRPVRPETVIAFVVRQSIMKQSFL